MLPSLAAALLLAQAPAALSAPQPMPTGDALEERIVANDARLFWGFSKAAIPMRFPIWSIRTFACFTILSACHFRAGHR